MEVMRRTNLLDEIETSALDQNADLPSVLRKCIALGGATGSESLRKWAALELKGYGSGDELPDYRLGAAPLLIDGVAGYNQIKGQQLPYNAIPEVARDKITTDIEFRQPIAELIQLAARNEEVRLMPHGASELVALMNYQIQEKETQNYPGTYEPTRIVERLYWSVSSTALVRVVDVVRTNLVQLVAEMRAEMPSGTDVPSTEVAEQAVNIAIHGGKRNRVVVSQGGETANASNESTAASKDESSGRRVGWWIVGAATVVGAAAAVLAVVQ